jgi:hypothetical protein
MDARSARTALGLLAAGLLASASARAQTPEPHEPNVFERSGLFTRYAPVPDRYLPPDPQRDIFHVTQWNDKPTYTHPNLFCHNGLYGLPWEPKCTECNSPNFWGSPGRSSLCPGCERGHRMLRFPRNLTHPWRPICHYYGGGCWVPVYDTDPFVTGPGPNPWPFFYNWCKGG